MKLLKRIKTKKGTYLVNAEFTEDEMDFIIEVGISRMLELGAIPFITTGEDNIYKVVPPSKVAS